MELTELVNSTIRVVEGSPSQIDVIMTKFTLFKDTTVVPFSGSDYHLIATHLFPRGLCDWLPHKFMAERNR